MAYVEWFVCTPWIFGAASREFTTHARQGPGVGHASRLYVFRKSNAKSGFRKSTAGEPGLIKSGFRISTNELV